MFKVNATGSFDRTERFLRKMATLDVPAILSKYGQLGVDALANSTPRESGLTAGSWSYDVTYTSGVYSINWKNSHIVDGNPIAILLQFGHGTGTGGYVQGRDYINPAIKPIFDKIEAEVWKVVTSA